MFTHSLDPVLFDFGFIEIRWYSLAYIFGILIGWWYGKKIILNKFFHNEKKFEINQFDDLITYIIISIIIGGRIGYVLFYNFQYYFSKPMEIFKIWEGGMSFHGALIGVIFGTWLFAHRRNIQTFFLLDIVACVAPIGIFFGRLANFVNGELVGKTTDLFWGVIFPSIDTIPRHPSQIYEALLEGVVLFFILNLVIFRKNYKTGTCSYLFLVNYGALRIFSEFFREPDLQLGYLFFSLSMGQVLSLIMIFIGFVIMISLRKKNEI